MDQKSDTFEKDVKLDDHLESDDMEIDELDDNSSESSDDSAAEQKLLEKENVLKAKIEEIQTNLSAYPYQYQLYPELIQAQRDLGLYNELKHSRETMSEIFPLDQTLWLDWIQDEIKLSSSFEEYEKILELFDKALEDYLSIPLWELYLNFLIEKSEEEDQDSLEEKKARFDLTSIREKMSRAISVTGYHFTESSKIWDIVRSFEENQLMINPSQDQVKRVNDLFVTRLSVPHPELDLNFAKYSAFVSSHLQTESYEDTMKNASRIHSNSLQLSLELGPYEDYLKEYSYSVEAYMEYISFLKTQLVQANHDNKLTWIQFILNIHERAIAQHPLQVTLWEAYISFLYTDFTVEAIISKTAYRSIRNCPWSGLLWVTYIRSLEKEELDQIEGVFSKALKLGLIKHNCEEFVQLLIERCFMHLRKLSGVEENKIQIRSIFRQSTDLLYENFPSGDINWRLLRHWANVEIVNFQDLDSARKVWNEIIRKHKNFSKAWIEYVEFERKYGSIVKARGLLKQSSRTLTDYPESILNFWLDFDRLYGDNKTNQTTFSDIYTAKTRQSNKALQEAQKNEAVQMAIEAKKERAREKDRANKSRKREKRKLTNSKEDGLLNHDTDGMKVKENHTAINDSNVEPLKQKRKLDFGNDGTTLYVCNFNENVDSAVLRTLFEKFGNIVEIRRPNTKFAFSRRFAYIQFSSQKEANDALAMDGYLLHPDFPLSVKLSDPSQRRHRADKKESEAPSPKRLFISNLPFKMTQASLLALLQPFGAVKTVRFLSVRNGLHNGCAIAEFDVDASGQAALSLNSTQVEGRIISVAIADPAARRTRPEKPHATPHSDHVQSADTKRDIKKVQAFRPRQVQAQKPHSKINVPLAKK